jgi:predicted transposase/invertase (TIGR01784 family)
MSAERVMERVRWDKEEWARALSRQRGEMDYRSDLASARGKGRIEGITIGKKQEKLEAARKMKGDGLGLEQIARYSGLSRREIEGL